MFSSIVKIFKYILYIILTIPRDIKGLRMIRKVKGKIKHYEDLGYSVTDIFQVWAKKQPTKACFIFEDTVWTFQDVEVYARKMASLFSQRFGLKKGDCVALLMENKPEYVAIWYGLSKLGVITACINTNQKMKTLVHSIQVSKAKFLIYDEDLEQKIFDVKDEIDVNLIRNGTSLPVADAFKSVLTLNKLINDSTDIFSPVEKITGRDILMYIFTSGTTGLPKPAIIKNDRYIAGGFTFFDAAQLTSDDIFYCTLPVYHSNGGVIGIGAALISGATVVIRKKFSASQFWKEVAKHNCTAFSYVGEVCRYLINQPPSELDRKHKIRVCIGNGMRGPIQREFLNRFNIRCMEIYGATEGNCVLVNTDSKIGACGFIPLSNAFLKVLPNYIIKIDEHFNVVRDENGHCIEVEFGETGLLVGIIGRSTREEYSGYANSSDASNKKIIKNLFKENQNAFNTGDLVVMDWRGYIYFVDRLGDTFRWKGENVSTIEVENIISERLNSIEVIVYGVQIPGHEGRAGMATITKLEVDLNELGDHLKQDLPAYAKPLFVRLKENVDHTGSFKAQKSVLIEEAFNVNIFSDPTYYFDQKAQRYLPLDKSALGKINNGLITF